MSDTQSWHIEVAFTEGEAGWVLSEMTIEPKAGPGVLDAIARVCTLLSKNDKAIRGGYWSGTP